MTSPTPQITTLIPTYRRPQLVRRAIRSALNQTYEDIRVLVVDNASGDETSEVVAQIAREDPRVVYHCHSENIGMTNNFNFAMRQVETPFFSFLSDDDVLLPEFYHNALQGFDRYPGAVFSAGTIVSLSEQRGGARMGGRMPREGYYEPPEGLFEWKFASHPMIMGNLIRREVVERYGLLQDILTADLDFELRVVAQEPYVISHQPFAISISHDSNATKLAPPEIWWKSFQTIRCSLESISALNSELCERVVQQLHEDFAHHIYQLGMLSALRHNYAYPREAANTLRTCYHAERSAAKLEKTLMLMEHVWPARVCVDALYRARTRLKDWKYRDVERRYRSFMEPAE